MIDVSTPLKNYGKIMLYNTFHHLNLIHHKHDFWTDTSKDAAIGILSITKKCVPSILWNGRRESLDLQFLTLALKPYQNLDMNSVLQRLFASFYPSRFLGVFASLSFPQFTECLVLSVLCGLN